MIRLNLGNTIRNAPLRYHQAKTLIRKFTFPGRAHFGSDQIGPRKLERFYNPLRRGRQIKVLR